MKTARIILPILLACIYAATLKGDEVTLKEAFKDHFYIGSAFGNSLFQEAGQPTLKLISNQFNTISPENVLKWQPFNPEPDVYNYKPADAFVAFGTEHEMYVVGHVLFWHSQTPEWVFQDDKGLPLSRAQLLERMRERVRHVAKRYGSKIKAWDVVNESIMDDGRLRDSQWTRIIGDDFIEQAFRIASEELPPEVELIYNDYSMAGAGKRNAVVKLVRDLKKKGVRIDGVGMQGHWSIDSPRVEEIEASIIAFAGAGVDVHITELDIDVLPRKVGMYGADVALRLGGDPGMDPYREGLPEAMQKRLADRYTSIFWIFLKHQDKIKRVTFWGPTDKHSWLNNWPIKGRTSYPMLFDLDGNPKPAFYAVIDLVKKIGAKADL